MNAVVDAALPIFGLILLGFVAGRRSFLGDGAVDVLNRFVVHLALPSLLFLAMARIHWNELTNWAFLGAFGGGIVVTFGIALAIERRTVSNWTALGIRSMSAAYANTGLMGVPLSFIVLGPESLPAVAIATAITVCPLMSLGVLVVGFDQQAAGSRSNSFKLVGLSLLKNPLLIGPVLGLLWAATGMDLPGAAIQFTTLLGNAASPCALITIGLFLAEERRVGIALSEARVVSYKLILQPAITALIALLQFSERTVWSDSAILLSALPIGTGPFLLARLSGAEATLASRSIFWSTVCSLVTVSVLIVLLD